jgi:tetratricopeptide (TPR) repeat protein
LSLKRYAAAATDSRRAVALAPTFGKAHARLGQSLYFLKDYEGAVAAYEEAIFFEPDNAVTKTYLEKARKKVKKQLEGKNVSDSLSTADTTTLANSIATDPHAEAAVVTTGGFRGSSTQIMRAVATIPDKDLSPRKKLFQDSPIKQESDALANQEMSRVSAIKGKGFTSREQQGSEIQKQDHSQVVNEVPQDDPDFDEAVRIQQRANRFLAAKRYKQAIEEYSAALFLVPDDPFLSPELHLGRAHALNGSRRHESARNDSLLAVKIRPTPEAYSTLAKSSFYLGDYTGCIESFDECIALLPNGETLSEFDQAYYDKAEAALEDCEDDGRSVGSRSLRSIKSIVPKLPPPRFVPREQVIKD